METKDTAVTKGGDYSLVNSVATRVRAYIERGELVLPANYSPENALKSAWLILQETVDKEKRPVLQTCSQASIANCLLDMIVQGLSPGKRQAYFIAYGSKLMCQRSYFGTMAVAERVAGASDIWAEVVYAGDEFEYELSHGQKTITKHSQKLGNIKLGDIVAAYCVIEFGNDKPSYTEIMTIEQIKTAWSKSKMNPDSPSSTHSLYPEEMAKRTVINRACKKLINSSSDSNLFLESFNKADEEATETEMTEEIAEHANKDIIDVDIETGEIVEEEPMVPEIPPKTETPPATETKKTQRDPASLKTIAEMTRACFDDFGLQPAQVVEELGYSNKIEIVELPKDCYLKIKATYGARQEEGEPGF